MRHFYTSPVMPRSSKNFPQQKLRSGEPRLAPRCQEDDPTPEIAKRAYELYERRGRQNGQTVQDWLHAEREIKMEAKR
jgi:hypothetical protein